MVEDLAEEQLGAIQLRIIEELVRLVLLDDLTEIHENDAVGDRRCKPHFVGHTEHRHS